MLLPVPCWVDAARVRRIGACCAVDRLQLKPDPFFDLATLRLLGFLLEGIRERKRCIAVARRSKMAPGRLSALDEDGLCGGSAPKADARQMRNVTGMNLPTPQQK